MHPLPPLDPGASRYALLRRRFKAAVVALYENTAMPVREIAALAGTTERYIFAELRRLGAAPRKPAARCRGLGHGPRSGTRGGLLDAAELASVAATLRETTQALRDDLKGRLAAGAVRERQAVAWRAERAAARGEGAESRARSARCKELLALANSLVAKMEAEQDAKAEAAARAQWISPDSEWDWQQYKKNFLRKR